MVTNSPYTYQVKTDSLRTSITETALIDCGFSVLERTANKYNQLFSVKKITSALIFIALFYYDIIADILLAIEYYRMRVWMYFGLTIIFIAVPLGVVNVYNIYLLCTGENYASKHRCVPLRIVFSIPFMSAPIDGTVVITYCSLKNGVQWRMSEGDFETYFNVIVAFMEDIPQLALQMYITLTESADDISMPTQVLRYISMLASWLSVNTPMLYNQ